MSPEQISAWEVHQADREAARMAQRAEKEGKAYGCTDAERQFYTENRSGLLKLGRTMPQQSARQAFTSAGCVAVIASVIAEGSYTRDEVLHLAQARSRSSYKQIGFLVRQLQGDDREQNLWYKNAGGRYRLHRLERKPRKASERASSAQA